ncbi:cell division suppressor protein YneA [Peribacillus alkalitolerans]|uniref:cell division suppressor protein YneA n=1 Tax=Peribacillus alkalitolerans TaxID=1550385 RepID=UPI0013D182BA|nr:LysM peptidoglycan-binding domain-containing protein [Peribacillus alkalitolerans]
MIVLKTLLDRYSFTILLMGVSLALSVVILFHLSKAPTEEFLSVTVSKGDTVWELANQYETEDLSKQDIISWIEEHNEINIHEIKPGQSIVLPIKSSMDENQYASK